ncbi:hypothetical protein GZ159_09485 [Staphylococcus aureus]|uniref:hypothetical protein n=1 Tax=Staphylococcus aureus TaxID=1280 RepID=UPI0013A690D3|nr:hypothetical protein [Staphylococcus aureus]NDQ74003.1 hypothetical protein [Staphylococcus aureus]HDE8374467.1 hypothetical protein [Staphylococcus aureus]
MYNSLTVKCDILELGNLRLSEPKHIHTFINKGYYVYESYRIFDNGHKLNVMLGVKHGKKYLIISDIENKSYQVEEFNGNSLIYVIRYLNKDGLDKLIYSLRDDSVNKIDILEHERVKEFKNKLEICVNNLRLKSIILCGTLITSVIALVSLF